MSLTPSCFVIIGAERERFGRLAWGLFLSFFFEKFIKLHCSSKRNARQVLSTIEQTEVWLFEPHVMITGEGHQTLPVRLEIDGFFG